MLPAEDETSSTFAEYFGSVPDFSRFPEAAKTDGAPRMRIYTKSDAFLWAKKQIAATPLAGTSGELSNCSRHDQRRVDRCRRRLFTPSEPVG